MNEEFKETFWDWLQKNTDFYPARGHHKTDIGKAIDYTISALKMD